MSKKKKEVYILQATYKDNDPETIGAYDSMQAMMRGFAKCIAEEVASDVGTAKSEDLSHAVARELADLIPAFFDENYPRDEEGFIRYGKTKYGYETMEVESVDDCDCESKDGND